MTSSKSDFPKIINYTNQMNHEPKHVNIHLSKRETVRKHFEMSPNILLQMCTPVNEYHRINQGVEERQKVSRNIHKIHLVRNVPRIPGLEGELRREVKGVTDEERGRELQYCHRCSGVCLSASPQIFSSFG